MDKFALFVNNPLDFVTTMISYGEMLESMSSSQKKKYAKRIDANLFIISGLPNKITNLQTYTTLHYNLFWSCKVF